MRYNRDMKVKVEVYAKINLALNITGTRGSFHTLDTVMASIGLSDIVTLERREDGKINLEFSSGMRSEGTNAYKAAQLLTDKFHLGGADIYIEERIPTGGGLGGSSADAAGVIHGFRGIFGIREREALEVAAEIGSDVPFMLRGGYGRLTGTHRELGYFTGEFGEVLLCGKGSVNTGECFRAFDGGRYDGIVSDVDALIESMKSGGVSEGAQHFGNALFAPACTLNPHISKIHGIMQNNGLNACMTGSGSYVFGVGDDLASAAKALEREGYEPIRVSIKSKGIKCE